MVEFYRFKAYPINQIIFFLFSKSFQVLFSSCVNPRTPDALNPFRIGIVFGFASYIFSFPLQQHHFSATLPCAINGSPAGVKDLT
jgi:hypothetical protein